MSDATSASPARVGGSEFRPYLEGLRGLSAMYVVMHHAALQVFGDITWAGRALQSLCVFGHYSVAVFIVLSGYCLMLPVLQTADGRLRGGFRNYLLRRARRILPAYYAAIALVLAILAIVPAWRLPGGTRWDDSLPATSWDVVVSHLLLVHNLNGNWFGKLDGPLWSVGTEWQIYFLFPLLLAIWRRFGMALAVAFGFTLGYGIALGFLSAGIPDGFVACPYYLGLFALGMAAAHRAGRGPQLSPAELRFRWPAQAAACVALAALFLVADAKLGLLSARGIPQRTILDAVVGFATAGFLLHCARVAAHRKRALSLRVLEHPAVLWLGAMSYSLYLIHDPLLSFQNRALFDLGVSPKVRFWSLFVPGIPMVLAIAYLFYLAIERRFMARSVRVAPVLSAATRTDRV